jgi:hypothetical protein
MVLALSAVVTVVLAPLVFLGVETDGDALIPPAGELVVTGIYVVLIFALTFVVASVVQRRRRRPSTRRRQPSDV